MKYRKERAKLNVTFANKGLKPNVNKKQKCSKSAFNKHTIVKFFSWICLSKHH